MRKPVLSPRFQSPTSSDKSGGGVRLHHDRVPKTKNRKRKRNAEKRKCQSSAPAGAAARSKTERARLSASHRGSRQAVHYLLTQLQATLPGTWSRRALPALSYPSPGSTSRAGHSTGGNDAQSRPGAEVTSLRPRAPHSLRQSRCHRIASLEMSETCCRYSAVDGDSSQLRVCAHNIFFNRAGTNAQIRDSVVKFDVALQITPYSCD
jgi:hypothetical protein